MKWVNRLAATLVGLIGIGGKSERIRLLEMEMLRMQFQIEYVSKAIDILLQENKVAGPELDAGKWYNAKLNKDK